MTIIGYARVSTDGQSLQSQTEALHLAGCGRVYSEKISGAYSDISVGGTSRPRDFAALRLSTSSNLVGCSSCAVRTTLLGPFPSDATLIPALTSLNSECAVAKSRRVQSRWQ